MTFKEKVIMNGWSMTNGDYLFEKRKLLESNRNSSTDSYDTDARYVRQIKILLQPASVS